MEGGAFFFQCTLHGFARGLWQQRRQAVAQRINGFHLQTAIDQVIGELTADQATADNADFLNIVVGDSFAEVVVVQQVVDGVNVVQSVAGNRRTDDFGAQCQYQLLVVNLSGGVAAGGQGLGRGIDAGDLGHGPHAGVQVFTHTTCIFLCKGIGILILGEAGRQHRLGVGAAIVRGDHYDRGVFVELAQLANQTVARQAGTNYDDGSLAACARGFLMMGEIAGLRLFDHFKIFLAHTAVGAEPVFGDVFPASTRFNTGFRIAGFLVVHPSTNNTFPLTHTRSCSNYFYVLLRGCHGV